MKNMSDKRSLPNKRSTMQSMAGIGIVLAIIVFMAGCERSDPPDDFEWEIFGNIGIVITDYAGKSVKVRIPASIDYKSVAVIGGSAFAEKLLTSVTIPDSVLIIGGKAFMDNQLTSVTIPHSVTYIVDGAFAGNRLTSVTIPNSVTNIGDAAFMNNQLTSVTIGAGVSLSDDSFDNNLMQVYDGGGQQAGTYVKSGDSWTKR